MRPAGRFSRVWDQDSVVDLFDCIHFASHIFENLCAKGVICHHRRTQLYLWWIRVWCAPCALYHPQQALWSSAFFTCIIVRVRDCCSHNPSLYARVILLFPLQKICDAAPWRFLCIIATFRRRLDQLDPRLPLPSSFVAPLQQHPCLRWFRVTAGRWMRSSIVTVRSDPRRLLLLQRRLQCSRRGRYRSSSRMATIATKRGWKSTLVVHCTPFKTKEPCRACPFVP
jgi:hypothetical protein